VTTGCALRIDLGLLNGFIEIIILTLILCIEIYDTVVNTVDIIRIIVCKNHENLGGYIREKIFLCTRARLFWIPEGSVRGAGVPATAGYSDKRPEEVGNVVAMKYKIK